MKRVITLLALAICLNVSAQQRYEATWESLDTHECPAWYSDAKFGIFIHWGLYSVPSYTMKGTYAEWYWHALNENPETATASRRDRHYAITEFHNKVYGADFDYPEFRDHFTCELFNPDEWASIFKQSGAKYVVLTSKHHDGYCLWDNKEASESFGMAWNSVESGPKRDLVGELTNSVRDAGLKMGLYYSIWDWYNPYWTHQMQECVSSGTMDVDLTAEVEFVGEGKFTKAQIAESRAGLSKYVHEVMFPQFKELVMNYQPSLIFSDGDWWMDDDLWESRPLLAWLYNEAPNRDEVVINDRWGRVRGKHGDYFTTEYGSGFEGIERPWEENRGIGMSFGYNRIENLEDYRTEKELIFMLVDLVSRGGNLLLNIGPRADGTIPVIMQQRLAQIGDWLEVNGEAIFDTKSYKQSAQWSEGNIPTFTKSDFHNDFPIYEMTLSPKSGNAVKQMWFTQKQGTLYGLLPKLPEGESITIRDVELSQNPTITMLGVDGELGYEISGDDIVVDLSSIDRSNLPCHYVYTLKVEGISY
ncbi:MAG: alpha-L-fucosidase [Rikenellaceae bacterium]